VLSRVIPKKGLKITGSTIPTEVSLLIFQRQLKLTATRLLLE
jgi:hypothetical protein